MRRAALLVLLVLSTTVAGCEGAGGNAAHGRTAAPAAKSTQHAVKSGVQPAKSGNSRILTADGAWCWFQDPRALHFIGQYDRTYIGYITSAGDIAVMSQDTGSAAITQTTLHVGLATDDHAAPALEVLPDRRIAVFYSGHAGPHMYYRISKQPENIAAFGPEQIVPGSNNGAHGYTYANPIYLSAEHRTYLFFRGGNFKPSVTWSDDNLRTWAPIHTLILPDKTQTALARPYVQYATNGVDTIDLAFTDGHPRDVVANSVYVVRYRHGVVWTMTGKPLASLGRSVRGLPVVPFHIRPITPLYNGSGRDGEAWVQDIAIDHSGNPVVVFDTFPATTDHRYHYARWTGNRWIDTEFARAGGSIDISGKEPDYSGGISLDQQDPSSLYTSREINGQWEIQHWRTSDGGATFGTPTAITTHSAQKNIRPVVPWGPPGDIQVLWMSGRYTHYSAGGYHTQLRELTSSVAPISTRIAAPDVASAGRTVRLGARVVQGYGGAPVSGSRAELWASAPGGSWRRVGTATTDGVGLVHFTVAQRQLTRYQVRVAATEDRGPSVSASVLVHVRAGSASRLSATPAAVHRGQTVRVGLRVVTGGLGLSHVHPQLWQRVGNGGWRLRGTYTTNRSGLAVVTTRPTRSVTYLARYPGDARYESSSSGLVSVRVR